MRFVEEILWISDLGKPHVLFQKEGIKRILGFA